MISHSERVREFFFEAVEGDVTDRTAVLDRASRDLSQADLAGLQALLGAHDRAGRFMQASPDGLDTGPSSLRDAIGATPARIGPFDVLLEVGEGGYGCVYLAEQKAPLRRTVAVKQLKQGIDTRLVLDRFDAERHTLALMAHDNIARVLEAGNEGDRPWFAMEWVDGPTITAYADQKHLFIRQRLELFLPVCAAVQHAHQKGVIHRDIKPANVLVATVDGVARPKVIDFGIARALHGPLAPATPPPDERPGLGTPQYMSPEQAGAAGGIQTQTDVYSLGIVLYELLTGHQPFDADTMAAADRDRRLEIIRTTLPAKPSERVLLPQATALLFLQPAQKARWAKQLAGDLDAIIAKATAKRPAERYASVEALIADISNYLGHRPVSPRKASVRYRAGKFLVRRRRAVAVATLLATVVVAGGVFGAAGFLQARQERAGRESQELLATANLNLANERQQRILLGEAAIDRRQKVLVAAQAALSDLFLPGPGLDEDDDSDAAFAARTRLEALEKRLANDPVKPPDELLAPLESVLQFSYYAIRDSTRAEQHGKAAIVVTRRLGPVVERKLAQNLATLASTQALQGRFADAMAPIAEAVALFKKTDPSADHARAPIVMLNYALILLNTRQVELSKKVVEEALTIVRTASNADRNDEQSILAAYAQALDVLGDSDAARDYYRRCAQERGFAMAF